MLVLRNPKTNKRYSRNKNGLKSDQRQTLHFYATTKISISVYEIQHMRRGVTIHVHCTDVCLSVSRKEWQSVREE